MRLRSVGAGAAFLAAFVLNPAYIAGCVTGDDPEYTYGAQEMAKLARAASDSFEFSDGTARYRLDLAIEPDTRKAETALEPRPFARSAYACGTRELYATAAACFDSSLMGVHGSLALYRIDGGSDEPVLTDIAVHGELMVADWNLSSGDMELEFDSGKLQLGSPDGKSFELGSFSSDAVKWFARD